MHLAPPCSWAQLRWATTHKDGTQVYETAPARRGAAGCQRFLSRYLALVPCLRTARLLITHKGHLQCPGWVAFLLPKAKIEKKVNLKSALPEDLNIEACTAVTCLSCSKAFKSLFPSCQHVQYRVSRGPLQILHSEHMPLARRRQVALINPKEPVF